MARFIHDQFAKDYLEELLAPFGEVKAPRRVSAEVREIDVWFSPTTNTDILGLLGKLAALTNFQANLQTTASLDQEERSLIMKLSPLYVQWEEAALKKGKELGIQQGIQQEKRLMVESMLEVKFGEIDEELAQIVEPLSELATKEVTQLIMQCDRSQLLARFKQ